MTATMMPDWTLALQDEFRDEFCAAIRDLGFAPLQRYPTPKLYGWPIGHEVRVLRKFLTHGTAQFDRSAREVRRRTVLSEDICAVCDGVAVVAQRVNEVTGYRSYQQGGGGPRYRMTSSSPSKECKF